MTERKHIPDSPECGKWEALLADALDGLLRPEDEAAFTAHKAACPECATLFDEARRGREWLEFLSPEPEMPEGLPDRIIARILAQTGPQRPELATAGAPMMIPAWQRPGLMGQLRRWAEPRLMMTAAMAFFSIALTLNLTGIRLAELRFASLRPTAVRAYMERQLAMASVPIIRYYDHSRLANEVQSRMRELFAEGRELAPELKSQPGEPKPGESERKNTSPQQREPQPATAGSEGSGHVVEAALRPKGI